MGRIVVNYVEELSRITHGPAKRMYEYIKERGRYFEGAMSSSVLHRALLASVFFRPRLKECYFNAQMLALVSGFRNIEYYEGIASWLAPTTHAWNVYRGRVIDLTWENLPDVKLERLQYYGVPIPLEFVRKNNPIKRRAAEMLLIRYLEEIGYIQKLGGNRYPYILVYL